jgi:DNA-binding beta-propeller fold protein YncE
LVAVYRPDGTQVGQAAAGAGPTHVVAGAGGYFFVADTLGGSLLVYRLDGDRVRETAHVGLGKGSRPYGLASDPSSGWVYVTLTGDDQVVGLRFADGRVAERRTWATGQQPNSVAVDPGARSLVVADTASDQVEFIPLP